jgi:hypothetical protein
MPSRSHRGAPGIATLFGLLPAACSPLSEQVMDPSAGINGGFEHTREGLPVNWLVYSPDTISSGSYELSFDRTDFKEGAQSLQFQVESCSDDGGRSSPGISQQYAASPGEVYSVSFWIKNQGCDWTVSIGGVAPKVGEYVHVTSDEFPSEGWQRVEREYTLPPQYDELRLQLSIRSPGSLWFDGLEIEPAVEVARP